MTHSRKSENWKKVGYVGVDSGTLLLSDPAYMKDELPSYEEIVGLKKSKRVKPKKSTLKHDTAQIFFKKGHSGAGVVTTTGYGDGHYPVYAKITDEGEWGKRVSEIKVKFI